VRLVWLELRDVRRYEALEFAPAPGVNVLIGDNGSGKTTVLESISYLAGLRSFRGSPDGSLVRVGSAAAVMRGEFERGGSTLRVEVEIPEAGRRRVLLNGKRPSGRAALQAELPVVSFLPDDLDLVKRGPAQRREFVDSVAVALRPAGAPDFDGYERAVRQRTALLRKEGRHADGSTLDVWDERIADLGAAVIGRRLDTLRSLLPAADEVVADLAEGADPLGWAYRSAGAGGLGEGTAVEGLRDTLAAALAEARQGDMERRITSVGPHRDEVVLSIGERDVRTRASQGEQRSVALALRIAAHRLLTAVGEPPVLLLDDVFSELDPGRSDRLVTRFPSGQVFVTSARHEEVPVHGERWVVARDDITRWEAP
jgi:DNA replication and repair protein RecF